eukprot:364047-Chlamydomonas_euryale.AAC.1
MACGPSRPPGAAVPFPFAVWCAPRRAGASATARVPLRPPGEAAPVAGRPPRRSVAVVPLVDAPLTSASRTAGAGAAVAGPAAAAEATAASPPPSAHSGRAGIDLGGGGRAEGGGEAIGCSPSRNGWRLLGGEWARKGGNGCGRPPGAHHPRASVPPGGFSERRAARLEANILKLENHQAVWLLTLRGAAA